MLPIFTKYLLSDWPEREGIEGWTDSGKRKVGEVGSSLERRQREVEIGLKARV